MAIIDSADDLNPNAANAVLKTLEEPPERGVLFLVSHSAGRAAAHHPLALPPPGVRRAAGRGRRALAWPMRANVSPEAAYALLRMARGAPGRALRLAAQGALEIDAEAARAGGAAAGDRRRRRAASGRRLPRAPKARSASRS